MIAVPFDKSEMKGQHEKVIALPYQVSVKERIVAEVPKALWSDASIHIKFVQVLEEAAKSCGCLHSM